MVACARIGVSKILVCNRGIERATKLAVRFTHLHHDLSGVAVETGALNNLTDPAVLGGVALIINATPMGISNSGFAPLAYDATRADCVFYDMVYSREPTPFLAPALALGRRALDGAGMLLNQGVLAFELFNKVVAPTAAMRAALMSALGRA
jgi:shikimate dehydrogenase